MTATKYLPGPAALGTLLLLLGAGTGALANISAYLSGEFKVPVEVMNPFAVLSEPAKNIPAEVLPSMSIACGLALRKLKDWQ